MDNPPFLFHRPAFVFRNAKSSIIPFESHFAKIYFSRVGDSLLSLDRAPFGSFIMEPGSTKSELISLVEKIHEWSKANHITHLTIRSFPDIYAADQSSLIKSVLLESGFTIKCEDIAQVISVEADQEMKMNAHKKRRLRKAQSLAFSFRRVSLEFLEESYALIVESRNNKSYPVTMTLADLEGMFKLFPEDYLLFGVFDKNKMIAVSICIKINAQILYCFYIGDLLEYRTYSPVTFLVRGIYDFCINHHVNFLDLGLSTDGGVLNKGLYAFKKSFGSFDSHKLTFEKLL